MQRRLISNQVRTTMMTVLFSLLSEAPFAYNGTNDTQQVFTAFYNEEVILNCSATKGYPPPEYTWFFIKNYDKGEPLLSIIPFWNPVLPVETMNGGIYTNGSVHFQCIRTNEFGYVEVDFFITLMPAPTQSPPKTLVNTEPVYTQQSSASDCEMSIAHSSAHSVNRIVSLSNAQSSPSSEVGSTTKGRSFNTMSILQLLGICLVAVLVLILIVVVVVVFRCWYSHRRRFIPKERLALRDS